MTIRKEMIGNVVIAEYEEVLCSYCLGSMEIPRTNRHAAITEHVCESCAEDTVMLDLKHYRPRNTIPEYIAEYDYEKILSLITSGKRHRRDFNSVDLFRVRMRERSLPFQGADA